MLSAVVGINWGDEGKWQAIDLLCRNYADLPENARKYIEYIEREVGCTVDYISVGAKRDRIIIQ